MQLNSSPAVNEATGPARNGAAPSEMSKLIADVEEVLARAGHVVDLDVAKLRASLFQKLGMAKSGLMEGGRKMADATRTAATATDAYVHRSPWQSIGVAAVAGFAAGYLLARR
jgi:ElaB/YqjD/DUF883 family membrane-anchored ribosome-binding protein